MAQPIGSAIADRHSLQLAELFEPMEDVQSWIKDRAGRYRRVNRAFLLNYALGESAEVIGRTDDDLSPAFLDDQSHFAREFRKQIRQTPRQSPQAIGHTELRM